MFEQRLYSCCSSLSSSKVTERKKSAEQLLEMLNDPDFIQFLNEKPVSDSNCSWNNVFRLTHDLVKKEIGNCRIDKQSSSTSSRQSNLKAFYTSLVTKVVRKANTGIPRIKYNTIYSNITDVLNDGSLLDVVGDIYLTLLLQDVISVRRYWGDVQGEDWQEMLSLFIKLYKAPSVRTERRITLAKLLTGVSAHGSSHSDLCLILRQRFTFLEEALKQATALKSPALQRELLQLSITLCKQVAMESRTATCQFGENVLQTVIDFYEHRLEDHQGKKSLMFEFFLLQVNLHHPKGQCEGEGAAYAYSWEQWRLHLSSLSRLLETEIGYMQRIKYNPGKKLTLPKIFLELTANVFKQVCMGSKHFVSPSNSNDSIASNTGQDDESRKRRRVSCGVQSLTDNVSQVFNSGAPHETWPWLAVLGHLLDTYPEVVHPSDFLSMLQLMAELQSSCKDTVVMNYLCCCCVSLLKVEASVKANLPNVEHCVSVWRKIWELTLRTVGLNQSEEGSHLLLQALIANGMIQIPTVLLHMFLSGVVRLSVHSLKTLQTVLNYCFIPEVIEKQQNLWQGVEQQTICVRSALLDWVLPSSEENLLSTNITSLPQALHSSVIVSLILKKSPPLPKKNTERSVSGYSSIIEDNYILSSFESGLVVSDIVSETVQVLQSDQLLFDINTKEKLFADLERLYTNLNQIVILPGEKGFASLLSLIAQTHLLAGILSVMLSLQIFSSRDLLKSRLSGILQELISKVASAAIAVITSEKCNSYAHDVLQLLTELLHLYEYDFEKSIFNLVREATPNNLLQVLHGAARNKVSAATSMNDDIDENYQDGRDWKGIRLLKENGIEENSLLSFDELRDSEKIQLTAISILCSFLPNKGCLTPSTREHIILSKLLAAAAAIDISKRTVCDFQMSVRVLSTALKMSSLDKDQVKATLEALQTLCRSWYKDADAAVVILSLLKDLYKQFDSVDCDATKDNSIIFIKAFQKNIRLKKYGPKVCVHFVKCLNEIAKVDPSLCWANWSCGSLTENSLCQSPSTPICEEALVFLRSPYHEVRMTAAKALATLFGGSTGRGTTRAEKHKWHTNMFCNLCAIIMSSFLVEGSLTTQVKIDEGANRTASALHSLAAVIVISADWRRKALVKMLQLIQEKNVNVELVNKVLRLVGNTLRLTSVSRFMKNNLHYLLVCWMDSFQLTDFPWQLFECQSDSEFFLKHCYEIVPVLLWKEKNEILTQLCEKTHQTMLQLMEACFLRVIACFLPCFAIDQDLHLYSITEQDQRVAKLLHANLEQLMGKDRVDSLITSHLGEIIVNILRLMFDADNFVELFGQRDVLPDPEPPFFTTVTIRKTLEYLQEESPNPECQLLDFIIQDYPQHIQKILLSLALDVHEATTEAERLLALHRYTFFADMMSDCSLKELAEFVLRDIVHTLVFIVKSSWAKKEEILTAKTCHFLHRFLNKCVPSYAKILENFVSFIVGTITPLAVQEGDLGREALNCIHSIVVEKRNCFLNAIRTLNPFPSDGVFDELRQSYVAALSKDSSDTLEDDIRLFLNANTGNWGSKTEGLVHIRIKLSDEKKELKCMYHELEMNRGFSEDCAQSLLHKLICKLLELTSDADAGIQLEASKCLGELGPVDLGSMVLKPEVKQERVPAPFRGCLSQAVSLLRDYIIDEEIAVVQAASAALHALLATRHGQQAIDTKDMKLLKPFKSSEPHGATDPQIKFNNDLFGRSIDNLALWCPPADCSHETWITELVCSLLRTFPDHLSLHHLISVCRVKVSFCEQMLPLLVEVVLFSGGEECRHIINRCINHFFSRQFTRAQASNPSAQQPQGSMEEIFCNRASVQCMLDVVHFVRLQRTPVLKKDGSRQPLDVTTNLDVHYLHVAVAAQHCLAYFTSILYAELWCDKVYSQLDNKRSVSLHNQMTMKLDSITQADPTGGLTVQNLLTEAYMRIGDKDAVYGCGSSRLLNPQSLVKHYEMLGKWDEVMLRYDIDLSNGNTSATRGMLFALERFGLHHLHQGYQTSLPPSHSDALSYDCLWLLGKWDTPVEACGGVSSVLQPPNARDAHPSSNKEDYAKQHFLALKCMHNKDMSGLHHAITSARRCVVDSLAYVSLESTKNLYPALSQLQALQEIEECARASETNNFDYVFKKWVFQDNFSVDEFSYLEPILAQRAAMLNILLETDSPARNVVSEMLVNTQLATATKARLEKSHQVAVRCLRKLSQTSDLPMQVVSKVKFEEACLAWDHGNEEVARVLLQSLLTRYSNSLPTSDTEIALYSLALQKFGNWMVETKSENPQAIIECYFLKSLDVLTDASSAVEHRIETYSSLARFADAQYQQINRYIKSSETERKRQACVEAINIKVDPNNKAGRLLRDMSRIDRKEIENAEKDKIDFLLQAIRYYVLLLEQGHTDEHNMQVFRLVSLWLENSTLKELDDLLHTSLNSIPSHKFLLVLPQLAPRMGNDMSDNFVRKINSLLGRCAEDHPHHTLPVVLALANSYKDQMYQPTDDNAKRTLEPRVLGAQQMIHSLLRNKKIGAIVQQMQLLSEALIELANHTTEKVKCGVFSFPRDSKIMKIKNLTSLLVPTMVLSVQHSGVYDNVVGIQRFESGFELVGGVNAPKKILCRCTDGLIRLQLVKGKDDLRQDAVMQQVFNMMNSVLRNNKETRKRKLIIRTYKVVPLSQCSGILEWCQNTEPIGTYLLGPNGKSGAHSYYYPHDLTNLECRSLIIDSVKYSNEKRLKVFLEICSEFHPVFHYFFLENFLTPGLWFERRLAFIHSVATTSMIGYILGLGDRHVNNILVDKTTAEVIHIDFGIAFEQGKVLPLPETVPFRLSRDIEDGMGASGVEGVFRRSCEKTMSVLRQNQETILTILEVLLYDPLYAWTITPSKAYKIQREKKRSKNETSSDQESSTVEVNKLAERALTRLRQKLQGTEENTAMSVAGQVNWLIQQARDPGNLCRLYHGWQAHL